jgi:hypothetical protein
MRIQRIALGVLGCLDIETESRANERPACFRVGIGCQDPPFVPVVAKDIHEALQIELNIGVLEIKQLLSAISWQRGSGILRGEILRCKRR